MAKFDLLKRLKKEEAEKIAKDLAMSTIQTNGFWVVTRPQKYHEKVCAILRNKYHIMSEQLDRRTTVFYLESYSENKKKKIMAMAEAEMKWMREMKEEIELQKKKALKKYGEFIAELLEKEM